MQGGYGDEQGCCSSSYRIGVSGSFQVTHKLKNNGALAVECFETRVWVGRDPADPSRIKSQPIPAEVIEMLSLP